MLSNTAKFKLTTIHTQFKQNQMFNQMRVTSISIAIVHIFICAFITADPTSYDWILSNNLQAAAVSKATTIDAQGNAYFLGQFRQQINFGAFTSPLLSNYLAIYLVKVTPQGQVVWANFLGSPSGNYYALGMAIDASGNIFVTGLQSPGIMATWSNDPNNVGPITSSNTYLIKLDGNGNPLQYIAGSPNILSIAVESGRVIVLCGFSLSAGFGGETQVTVPSHGVSLFRFSTTDLSYISSFTGQLHEHPVEATSKIAVNSAGSVCFCISNSGEISIGGETFTNSVRVPVIVRMLNDQVVYVKRFQNTKSIAQLRVSIDAEGNCYAAGSFLESLTIDSFTSSNVAAKYSLFVTKIDTTGTATYLQTSSPLSSSSVYWLPQLDCTDEGVCVVVGNLPAANQLLTVGSVSITHSTDRPSTMFVLRLDPDGSAKYLLTSSATNNADFHQGSQVKVDKQRSRVIVGGLYRGDFTLGTLSLTARTTAYASFFLQYSDIISLDLTGGCTAPYNRRCDLAGGGSICYNNNVHTCTPLGMLCPVGHLSCGNACYRPDLYSCFESSFLCPKDYQKCGQACYSPVIHVCLESTFLCPIGNLKCGQACYSPSTYSCTNNILYPL